MNFHLRYPQPNIQIWFHASNKHLIGHPYFYVNCSLPTKYHGMGMFYALLDWWSEWCAALISHLDGLVQDYSNFSTVTLSHRFVISQNMLLNCYRWFQLPWRFLWRHGNVRTAMITCSTNWRSRETYKWTIPAILLTNWTKGHPQNIRLIYI